MILDHDHTSQAPANHQHLLRVSLEWQKSRKHAQYSCYHLSSQDNFAVHYRDIGFSIIAQPYSVCLAQFTECTFTINTILNSSEVFSAAASSTTCSAIL